ncbi:unnamed protein product [Dibothriocephalus latus]|uniref:Uncharacterized protein n=1 Tax=Dibothriocephalus latus TaxID=60516 RepID=A0A3P7MBL7_DIBLA|nr:unnamed protein product [Dibothriocephalus latus]
MDLWLKPAEVAPFVPLPTAPSLDSGGDFGFNNGLLTIQLTFVKNTQLLQPDVPLLFILYGIGPEASSCMGLPY